MPSLPLKQYLRDHLADLGNRVSLRGTRLGIQRRGRGLFALVPVAKLKKELGL